MVSQCAYRGNRRSRSYRAAVHRCLPQARHVLDRFHPAHRYRPRADPGTKRSATPPTARCQTRVRTGPVQSPFLSATQKRPPHHRRPENAFRPAIRRSPASTGRLGRSARALRPLPTQRPPRRPRRFADPYETGQIPEYHNTVNTILNWSNEILNWHHHRRSNGPLEGTNNLIQTLRRTAHGFTNPQNYAARGLLLT